MPPFGKWDPAFYLEAIARQAIIAAIPRPKQEKRPTTPTANLFVCWTTVESEDDARSIANALIDERIAACVQIDGPIESIYNWEGKRCSSTEYRLSIKVLEDQLEATRKRVQNLHSYDTPQWIEVEVAKVKEKYLIWVQEASNFRCFHQKEPI
ncbi:MAG: divalent-cation tolerance protein CutA [Opitutales bacterium]|nr:divalent-cation tolerance protein CutA [Opitutales bacterium]MBT5815162.1 divalent-cation tolerance protein CutA [Opitutales bacterium]MBT6378620.1 divalent-cation tolerance protein CutA [Opitutales bacterium]MBT7867192.1 divalent-cation tolerance protein CutA [Opitutales bacterium]MDG2254620.1 divalent-cation tolerance protein CutA [Opitutaceae bacterium]